MVHKLAEESQNLESVKVEQQVFVSYLESISGKLSQYTSEILQDKLIVRSINKGKIKLDINVHTIAPFIDFDIRIIDAEGD